MDVNATSDEVLNLLQVIGTIAFAVSGALVAGVMGLVILGGIGGELGKRSQAQSQAAAPEAKAA